MYFPDQRLILYIALTSAKSKPNEKLLKKSLRDLVSQGIKLNLKDYTQFHIVGRENPSDEPKANLVV